MVMGCYGIGVTRIVAAAIEQNHDKDGIVWPVPIAPFEVALVALQADDPKLVAACDGIYDELEAAGIEVLYDDRDERPGVKFKDADLIGIPYRIAVGKKGLAEGVVEVKLRRGAGGAQGQDRRDRGAGGRRSRKERSDGDTTRKIRRPTASRRATASSSRSTCPTSGGWPSCSTAWRAAVVLQGRPRAVRRRGRARRRAGAEAQRADLPRPQAARHPRDRRARRGLGGAHRGRAADGAHLGRLRDAEPRRAGGGRRRSWASPC